MNTNFVAQKEKVDKYRRIKRAGALLAALTLWCISIAFNVDGFNFIIPERVWMGWVLGIVITIIELVWNSMKMETNLTLMVLGVMAYLYGMYTNIMGIMVATGQTTLAMDWGTAGIILFGILIEIAPEPLMVWALVPGHDDGDFLGNLVGYHPKPLVQQNQMKKFPPKPNFQPKMTFNAPVDGMRQQLRQENFQQMKGNFQNMQRH